MVGKIVDDGHAVDRAAHLQPATHALKAGQCRNGFGRRDADVFGRRNGRKRIGPVVGTGQRQAHRAEIVIAAHQRENGGIGLFPHIGGMPAAGAQRFLPAPAAAVDDALQGCRIVWPDDASLTGHGTHQMVELGLDGRQIGEDVGVIVFEVVQDGRARAVVHELGTLVEKGGVVLVGLDDEVRLAPQPRRYRKVARHPADQKARLSPGRFQNPCQQ